MNAQIRRLFFVFAALFVALVAMSTYWLWKAPDLEARRGNPQLVVRQVTIKRGLIYAANGKTIFATNRKKRVQGRTWYLRRYPSRGLVAQTVGYSTIERSRTGLEESLNDYLTGSNANLRTLYDRTVDTLKGVTRQGNDVVTTIDVTAQRTAMEALAGTCGAVVALDPRDGRILAIASTPTYDSNLAEKNFAQILGIKGPCEPASPLVNRATNDFFIPGSTFKVVTAAAALDSGRFTTQSTFDDPGYCTEYGKRVSNYADQDGAEVFGRVDFPTAMEHSINSVFCNIGKAIGPGLVLDYAKRFGFYEDPPLETPSEERLRSGLYQGDKLFEPAEPNQVDPGRLAFGQERLRVTPLQMAMVAAAIANGGILMEPHVVDRIVNPDGNVVSRTSPEQYREVVKAGTAADLTAMMRLVVESGTGTAAQIPGVPVAGKTGTAETGRQGQNDTWFIAFAPADRPRVVVAVALHNQSGTGGSTAAPIARALMQTLLSRKTLP
ncbi:MAG TPA: penicillin-binding protein 2 [Gaiellaceae bacterium]|nr:penicillin-binding protein 2 [Gaiellaceae bacterium]